MGHLRLHMASFIVNDLSSFYDFLDYIGPNNALFLSEEPLIDSDFVLLFINTRSSKFIPNDPIFSFGI